MLSFQNQGSCSCQQLHPGTQKHQPVSGADWALLLPSVQTHSWKILCRPPGCCCRGIYFIAWFCARVHCLAVFRPALKSCGGAVCENCVRYEQFYWLFTTLQAFSYSVLSLLLPAVICRKARLCVSPFQICSKSSSPQQPGSSFLFCAELQRIQSMRAHPNLQDMVKHKCNHTYMAINSSFYSISHPTKSPLYFSTYCNLSLCLCAPGFVGPAPNSVRWTCLMLDLQHTLSVYVNHSYRHVKSIKLCANLTVKNMFTSDLLLDPGGFSFCF